jgi:4-hydroxybenzoate polyprenyltransferase
VFKKFTKFVEFVKYEFLFNGHLQAVGASGIVYITYELLYAVVNAKVLISVYLVFQFIYFFDRYYGYKADATTNPERSLHIGKYLSIYPVLMILYLTLALAITVIYRDLNLLLFVLLVAIFGVLYPIYFKQLTKKIFMFKNFYVSLVFTVMPEYFGILYLGGSVDSLVLTMFTFYVFIESVFSQIMLDCKDVANDNQKGLKTLPVSIGFGKTLRFISIASVIFALMLFVLLLYTSLLNLVYLVFVGLLVNELCLYLIYRKNKYGYILAAGKYFIWLVLFVFVV